MNSISIPYYKMEDLISFEDLVVQPYNSYFNLEKELHELKSKLSLMETRLKYLEDKIGYGCKGNLTLEEKINALDIKYEELDDEIVILQEDILKDIGLINDKIEEGTKTIRAISLGCITPDRFSVDDKIFINPNLSSLINYVSSYNSIKVLSSKPTIYLKQFLNNNKVKIETLKIKTTSYSNIDFKDFIETFIKNNLIVKNIKVTLVYSFLDISYKEIKEIKEIKSLQKYCLENKIELIF